MKPRIYFDSGRWHVLMEGWPIHGYLLRENAYIRAETIWKRGAK